jgi:hypothetical protein
MWRQLFSAQTQSRAAKTVEIYGWIIFFEGGFLLLFPDTMANLLHFGPINPQASGFLRMVGLLVSGIGLLYLLSGRLNAGGFVFATLLDRPLVAPIVGLLWYFGALPGALALLFAIEDSASWLWTLLTWKVERRRS